MQELPNVPSELLALALNDLEAVEKLPQYEIDMHLWHLPENGKCIVCLAGSVMARSLGADCELELNPKAMGRQNEIKLAAINLFREGNVYLGLKLLGNKDLLRHLPEDLHYVNVYEYVRDTDKFKTDIRKIIRILKTTEKAYLAWQRAGRDIE